MKNNNLLSEVLPLPSLNNLLAADTLCSIIDEEINKTGLKKVVVGTSGGIDSALSLTLAVKALGRDNVKAYLMPYKTSSADSEGHGKLLCEKLGVDYWVVPITSMADAYFTEDPDMNVLRKGNIMARLRMVILYDVSSKHEALVLGTSNKTEMLIGYSTLWGDMASALNPIGDLYKGQVYSLSKFLEIPSEIIEKAPSADLWQGQSDEEELQLSYDLIDRVLYHWVDLCWSESRILETLSNVDDAYLTKVNSIFQRVIRSQFKRKMPLIAKISGRTINREFRFPRDWQL